jgi:micrococcal nuclease
VSYVHDGDTLDVMIGAKKETIRLIGIDTPEVKDPRKVVQCFGREASNRAHQLLDGRFVYLETDPAVGQRDKYGRLLAYVFLEDGRNFNKLMVEDGYAHEYTYNSQAYKYQKEFKQAQDDAMKNQRGLWASSTCGGNTTQPAK